LLFMQEMLLGNGGGSGAATVSYRTNAVDAGNNRTIDGVG
jgi:hypothetical protein